MSTNVENGGLNIPKFDGKRKNYALWKVQFEAVCSIKGCRECLDPKFRSELPNDEATTLDPTDNTQKKQIAAKAKMQRAMNLITLAMKTPSMLAKIQASKSKMIGLAENRTFSWKRWKENINRKIRWPLQSKRRN